jgi:hypothetical protein
MLNKAHDGDPFGFGESDFDVTALDKKLNPELPAEVSNLNVGVEDGNIKASADTVNVVTPEFDVKAKNAEVNANILGKGEGEPGVTAKADEVEVGKGPLSVNVENLDVKAGLTDLLNGNPDIKTGDIGINIGGISAKADGLDLENIRANPTQAVLSRYSNKPQFCLISRVCCPIKTNRAMYNLENKPKPPRFLVVGVFDVWLGGIHSRIDAALIGYNSFQVCHLCVSQIAINRTVSAVACTFCCVNYCDFDCKLRFVPRYIGFDVYLINLLFLISLL